MAFATRPLRPITRPISSGATLSSRTIEPPRRSSFTFTCDGSSTSDLAIYSIRSFIARTLFARTHPGSETSLSRRDRGQDKITQLLRRLLRALLRLRPQPQLPLRQRAREQVQP